MAVPVSQARRSHQRRIAKLLDELEQRRQRIYLLQARGARPAGLRDLKAELHAVRDKLAAAVDAASSSLVSPRRDQPQQTLSAATPAVRAADTRIDCTAVVREFGVELRPWRQALADTINRLLPNKGLP